MDAAWAYIEDRFYFPRTLPGYAEYVTRVPMLIPTWSSLKSALGTLLHRVGEAEEELHG